jgi:hypothetical protein
MDSEGTNLPSTPYSGEFRLIVFRMPGTARSISGPRAPRRRDHGFTAEFEASAGTLPITCRFQRKGWRG